ncbi:benzoate-CoA ligase family [Leptothrix cholodnii SP-6]|uniref:Benzoate-CoA ligase family n=1 Tax=Leptothrix cholodnii (strain ATCC 51168 / LMG 8142 / SP-6) TaxID=395495 RepID=B1Y513_LEPCP|nr:benzoate-CoA ligase family protein [Leptothrix cholodnii]ACB35909.1 benzoate-CoA ligase family [Leptothrix cholodnii SP-6]
MSIESTPDLQVPPPGERFNFAQHLIECNAARPDKAAFIDDLGTLSYGALEERVRRVAAGLRALGLKREERVLLLMHDCNDWPVSFLGAMYAGLVPVAVNTLLTADDYAYMLEHSRAQAALVSGALLPALTAAMVKSDHEVQKVIVSRPVAPLHPAEVEFETFLQSQAPLAKPATTARDDAGFWLYSSGSTGRPKGTVHSHANPYWTAELYGKGVLALREDDVCFSAAKLFFAYGLGNGLSFPMSVGATTLLMAERPTPDATFKRWLGQVGGAKPTVFFGAPTGFAGMLASPKLPAQSEVAMRLVSSAGEALPAELGERFKRHFGVDIVDGIGSTEMLHIFLSNRPERVRYGTTGWPVPGYEIALRGEDGGPVPDGEPGDLYIHGPSAAMMYWANQTKTRETFQGGWTKSGDKYVRNADGSYTYSGRSDDMLKVSGIYVSPFEVEATLVQHPAVLEAAVIGVPDAEGLTKTKAFVVLKDGAEASEDELKQFVKDRLAPYKYPRVIEFLRDLPKTATGKIQRFKLREKEATSK